jgi:LmbE family N-acetylglucosaminyl deacetylase
MKSLFVLNKRGPLRILCLGAHADDIEIGCGGAILRLATEYSNIDVNWVVFNSTRQRKIEARSSARVFLSNAKRKKIILLDFEDGFFPYKGERIKKNFEKLKKLLAPDIIFTHYRYDLHQDHQLISELTWNTFRDHFILEYEIVKYDGDLGAPNIFFPLSLSICQKKIGILMKSFKSQKLKDWFTEDAFYSIMRIRGIESRAPEKYAEAFYCRKLVL